MLLVFFVVYFGRSRTLIVGIEFQLQTTWLYIPWLPKFLSLSSEAREGVWQKSFLKFLFHKGLFENLHFYSTSVCHSQTTTSVLNLEGWNFAYRLLIFMPKKIATKFLNFCLEAVKGLKNCQNFIESQLSYYFFKSSHKMKARELIFCMDTAWTNA